MLDRSLVEVAKKFKVKDSSPRTMNEKQLAVAIAFVNGEINASQASKALERKVGYIHSCSGSLIRKGIERGLIEIREVPNGKGNH